MRRSFSERRRRAAGLLLLATSLGACAHLPPEREQALGHEFHRVLSREQPLLRDPIVHRYVEEIGHRLVRAAGLDPSAHRFHVVLHPGLNAFAAPGGFIYLHTGALLAAHDVSEVAGVLAHEIGHVAGRDVAENWERRQDAARARRVGVVAAGLTAGPLGAGAAGLLGGLGGLAWLNSFSRADERAADDFAVEILPGAGYDPRGLPSFFETLLRGDPIGAPEFLSSHPDTAERVTRSLEKIAEADVAAPIRADDGGRLQIIQRRIELLTRVGPSVALTGRLHEPAAPPSHAR
jgi:predicted Zn-dependent protease